MEEFKAKNYLMVYGSKQGKVAARNPNMVTNLLEHLRTRQDKATLCVEFPTVLYQMKGDDENLELSASHTIQTLRLYHKDSLYKHYFARTAAKAIGVVFINACSRDLEYKPYGVTIEAELSSTTQLFEALQIEDVRVFENCSKPEIIEQFKLLEEEAAIFEVEHREGEVLAIIVRWIGADCYLGRIGKVNLQGKVEWEAPFSETPIDGPCKSFIYDSHDYKFNRYGLTTEG